MSERQRQLLDVLRDELHHSSPKTTKAYESSSRNVHRYTAPRHLFNTIDVEREIRSKHAMRLSSRSGKYLQCGITVLYAKPLCDYLKEKTDANGLHSKRRRFDLHDAAGAVQR